MITSTANEKIKHVTELVRNAKARRKEGLFVVEGVRIAGEIPREVLVECFVSESFSDDRTVTEVFPYEVTPTMVSSSVFRKMSDTQNPQGIICVCRQKTLSEDDILTDPGSRLRLLVLEGIQDPGNLGTMVRTAEGAGFDALIADNATVDVYNPKVTRSTMGSLFRVPVIYSSDLPGVIDKLQRSSVTVYAAHLNGKTDYRDERYGNRIAFVIGNEGSGLSDRICAKADRLVRIPMQGRLESLNAAVAAAILMYSA